MFPLALRNAFPPGFRFARDCERIIAHPTPQNTKWSHFMISWFCGTVNVAELAANPIPFILIDSADQVKHVGKY